MSNLTTTQKRLIFRAWHRGTREMDLLLGRFADAHVPDMTPDDLKEFEALLSIEDPDLWDIVTGKQAVPEGQISAVMEKFIQQNHSGSKN